MISASDRDRVDKNAPISIEKQKFHIGDYLKSSDCVKIYTLTASVLKWSVVLRNQDNSTLSCRIPDSSMDNIKNTIERELQSVSKWVYSNKLVINAKK